MTNLTSRYAYCLIISLSALGCGETATPVDRSGIDGADAGNPQDCVALATCCATLSGADQGACNAIVTHGTGNQCSTTLSSYQAVSTCTGEDPVVELQPSTLFGACVEDWQCPGTNAVCRPPVDGYPHGYCTIPCPGGDRGPCDVENIFHHCVQHSDGEHYCERRCQNGIDCGRAEYTCEDRAGLNGGGMCIGICSSDEDCGDDAVCNVYSGECLAALGSGSVTGGACAGDGNCLSGNCNPSTSSSGAPNGWVDGYCLGRCILPFGYTSSALWSGANTELAANELPSGTCPESDVCYPSGSYTEGDPGLCLSGCTTNSDCRESDGYVCRKEFSLRTSTATYSRGVCWPISDCQETPCPEGLSCEGVPGGSGTVYVCSRSAS